MRIVFFGMSGVFSRSPLELLLAGGVEVSAVILPAASISRDPLPRRVEPTQPAAPALPVLEPYLTPNIVHLAWARQIPVWEIGSLSDRLTLTLLESFQSDLMIVACFPAIFPRAVLRLPRYGCLNLHPSLLPAYRGPIPLFWMARQGERQAGVTLHFMDEGVDSGDIVAQTAFDWPEGSSGAELEGYCGVAGGRLLLAAIEQLTQRGQLLRRPQAQSGATYFSWPADEDLVIPTHWEARRAFNFGRAASDWRLVVAAGPEQHFPIGRMLGYEADLTLEQPYRFERGELWIQFQSGVVRIQ